MTRPVFLGKVHKSFGLLPVALVVLLIVAPSQAGIDLRSKLMPGQPEPVKLVRKLPAVAERHGRTVGSSQLLQAAQSRKMSLPFCGRKFVLFCFTQRKGKSS
jgi:hypothetical protein